MRRIVPRNVIMFECNYTRVKTGWKHRYTADE